MNVTHVAKDTKANGAAAMMFPDMASLTATLKRKIVAAAIKTPEAISSGNVLIGAMIPQREGVWNG